MALQKDLKEFIELLNSHQIRYLIVGAHALAFHGFPRLTGDIDLFLEASLENAQKIIVVLTKFGFGSVALSVADFQQQHRVIQLGVSPNRIDLLTSISGVEFQEAWDAKVSASLDHTPVNFLSKEHLIQNKRTTGRERDLLDVKLLVGK